MSIDEDVLSGGSLVQKRDCRAEFILSAREGLAMTKSINDRPIGSLRGAQATKQSHVQILIEQ
jgi:hypothetical protein